MTMFPGKGEETRVDWRGDSAALQLRGQIKHCTIFYATHIPVPINGSAVHVTV
jgi:hypothetical protein